MRGGIMLTPVLFGIGLGFGLGLYRQMPPAAVQSPGALVVLVVLLIAFVYFLGRSRRPSAVAIATATAEATAVAQQAVYVHIGERTDPTADPLGSASWRGVTRPEVEGTVLEDGGLLTEVIEHSFDTETADG